MTGVGSPGRVHEAQLMTYLGWAIDLRRRPDVIWRLTGRDFPHVGADLQRSSVRVNLRQEVQVDRTSGHHAAVLAFASLVAVVLCDSPAFANGKLSFDDWLARQGTRCKDLDGDGTCCEPYDDQYIPANRSFINWFDPTGRAVVIDYLGLSGSYLAAS